MSSPEFREVPSGGPWITDLEVKYVSDACQNGWYKNWNGYLAKFERAIAQYSGNQYAMATSSCTGALHLTMLGLGIGPGDEVIVPEVSWIATVTCVCYVGATPVFVDVEKDTWCLDPKAMAKAITPKTKAVIPAHMYGHPADMMEINALAKKHNIYVVEDAAPGIGSKIDGRPAGSFGDMAAFSFQGAKPLVMGEGGAVVSNNKELYERAYYYWDHCRDKNKVLYNTGIGYKYKLSNVQAALGLAQVERADQIVQKRRDIFFWYQEKLGNIKGLSMNVERKGYYNNYYVPTIIMDDDFGVTPEQVMREMDQHGVRNRPFFRAMSKFPMFKPVQTPVADHLAERGINLPCASILTKEDVDFASKIVRKALRV